MRVVGYYRPFPWMRIGSDRTGYTAVERDLRSYCRRNDLALVGFFVETDSRTKRSLEDREAGREVMKRLRSGLADEILVWRPEHIFTSAGDGVNSLERWIDEGIGFRCADFFDGAPLHLAPEAQLLNAELLIHGLATLQRSIDYEQTRARLKSRKARRAWSGRPPFGFTLQDGTLVEDEDRIARIQQMKSLHRRGKSYRKIALEFDISIGTAHRLVKTDLRKLRQIAQNSERAPAGDGESEDRAES
jgi:DNA invertase Pin-like site-specific DNA recombinase